MKLLILSQTSIVEQLKVANEKVITKFHITLYGTCLSIHAGIILC